MEALNKHTMQKTQHTERIIQFGEGNFLRAFVDWIIHYMNERTHFDSSVVVVQPIAHGKVDVLSSQDGLYHVHLQGLDKGQVIDSMTLIDVVSRAINPYTQYDAFLQLATQPDIRFVISNTTEAGIVFDPSCAWGDTPATSYPGKLTQLLYHRYQTFQGDVSKGLIIFPCELIFHNGKKLRETILQYIDLWQLGEGFRAWFTTACSIYSTLVDRIVPGFPQKDITRIRERLPYDDALMVQAEAYHLWVIEAPATVADIFPADRAGVNVLFVSDETPYHERKVSLLNAPHTVLSPIAFLAGIDTVRAACQHEVIGAFVRRVMFNEILPTLSLPREELLSFAEDVLERFLNPFIDHQVTSIMLNSFPKYLARVLPRVKVYLQQKGRLPEGLVLGLAAIIVYYRGGQRADGRAIVPQDAATTIALLQHLWATDDTRVVVDGVLGARAIWDEDLSVLPGLPLAVRYYVDSILSQGIIATIRAIL